MLFPSSISEDKNQNKKWNINSARQSPYMSFKIRFRHTRYSLMKNRLILIFEFFLTEKQISQRISKNCSMSKNGRVRKKGQWIFSLTFYELKCTAKYTLYIFPYPSILGRRAVFKIICDICSHEKNFQKLNKTVFH